MNKKEQIFLQTIEDLKDRVENCTEYNLLKSSGLLRQLLIDENSLLNQANKAHKLKIRFRVQQRFDMFLERKSTTDGKTWQPLYGMIQILPAEESSYVELLTLDNFLKYKLLFNGEFGYSVLDIIKICAHKYGGIHLEDIKKPNDLPLDSLNNHFKFNDLSSIFHSLYGIIRISLLALGPLVNEINTKN